MLKERFFNEIVKLPRECPCVLGGQTAAKLSQHLGSRLIILAIPFFQDRGGGPAEGSVTNERNRSLCALTSLGRMFYNLEDSER